MSTLEEIKAAVADAVSKASSWLAADDKPHWEFMPESVNAAWYVLEDGRMTQRHYDWIELPNDARAAFYGATRLLLDLSKRGRGRVWFYGLPVHVINDDGMAACLDSPDGGPVIRLRTIAYMEAMAK